MGGLDIRGGQRAGRELAVQAQFLERRQIDLGCLLLFAAAGFGRLLALRLLGAAGRQIIVHVQFIQIEVELERRTLEVLDAGRALERAVVERGQYLLELGPVVVDIELGIKARRRQRARFLRRRRIDAQLVHHRTRIETLEGHPARVGGLVVQADAVDVGGHVQAGALESHAGKLQAALGGVVFAVAGQRCLLLAVGHALTLGQHAQRHVGKAIELIGDIGFDPGHQVEVRGQVFLGCGEIAREFQPYRLAVDETPRTQAHVGQAIVRAGGLVAPGNGRVGHIDRADLQRFEGEAAFGLGPGIDIVRGFGLLGLFGLGLSLAQMFADISPVAAPVGVAREAQAQAVERDRTHLDLALDQRQQLDADLGRIHFRHRFVAEAFGVGYLDPPQFEAQPGKDREPDIAADIHLAADLAFDGGVDLRLVIVGVENQRQGDHRHHDQRNEHAQHGKQNAKSTFHAGKAILRNCQSGARRAWTGRIDPRCRSVFPADADACIPAGASRMQPRGALF